MDKEYIIRTYQAELIKKKYTKRTIAPLVGNQILTKKEFQQVIDILQDTPIEKIFFCIWRLEKNTNEIVKSGLEIIKNETEYVIQLNLNKGDVLLSKHRSISLFNIKTYSTIYTWHIDEKDKKSLIYHNFLKSKKVNRILLYGNKLETEPFTKCLGKQLFFKEN